MAPIANESSASPPSTTLSNSSPSPSNPTPSSSLPPEVIAFATRIYDAARQGDIAIFQQALPAGLPPNMTNEKGDSLV